MSKMLNLERVLARLAQVPEVVQTAVSRQLDIEVADLVAAQKRAAPVDEAAPNPGQLRDSVHAYRNPDRPLSYRILADAMDEDGKLIGSNVVLGHKARDGSHVPPRPFFFPTWRARKRGAKRRMAAAAKKPIQQLYPKG